MSKKIKPEIDLPTEVTSIALTLKEIITWEG